MCKLGEILQTTPRNRGAEGIGVSAVPYGDRTIPALSDKGHRSKSRKGGRPATHHEGIAWPHTGVFCGAGRETETRRSQRIAFAGPYARSRTNNHDRGGTRYRLPPKPGNRKPILPFKKDTPRRTRHETRPGQARSSPQNKLLLCGLEIVKIPPSPIHHFTDARVQVDFRLPA